MKWNVHLTTRYALRAPVWPLISRAISRGGPLKNTQLVAVSQEHIGFRYCPHRDEGDTSSERVLMHLSPEQFFARYLAHVPPPGLQSLRAYGLYAHTQRARLNCVRECLGQSPSETPAPLSAADFIARFANAAVCTHCPRCGRALIPAPLRTHATGPPPLLH